MKTVIADRTLMQGVLQKNLAIMVIVMAGVYIIWVVKGPKLTATALH